MIRMMQVRIFESWEKFLLFFREYELKTDLEKMEFHQDGRGQIVVRLTTGEPDAIKRATYLARGET